MINMNTSIKILKDIGLLSLYLLILTALGLSIDYFIVTYNLLGWLTSLFSIAKFFTKSIAFMWDTTTMWRVVGLVMSLEIVWWGYLAAVGVIKWFK